MLIRPGLLMGGRNSPASVSGEATLTEINYVAAASNGVAASGVSPSTYTLSSGIQAGDLIFWLEGLYTGSAWSGGPSNVPSGFTALVNAGSFQNWTCSAYKVATSADIGRTLTGLLQLGGVAPGYRRWAMVLRGNVPLVSATKRSVTGGCTDSAPATLTIPAGDGGRTDPYLQITAKRDRGGTINDPSAWTTLTWDSSQTYSNEMKWAWKFYTDESTAGAGSCAFSDDNSGNHTMAGGLQLAI